MYIVYALRSGKDERIYVGMTRNLQFRLTEHNQGYVFSTKGYKPWKVIYTEQEPTRIAVRKREKFLRGGFGKEFLKRLI